MAKYTEEQLLELKSEAHTPKPEILDAFNKLIEELKNPLNNTTASKAQWRYLY